METHLIVCKNEITINELMKNAVLLGRAAKSGRAVSQGDALVARDILLESGLQWGVDFYLKKIDY
jgi:hypothetical protein